jgi:hypothetical protein
VNLCDIINIVDFTGGEIMPATITHSFFAKDVYDILPKDIKNSLDISRTKMFAQSTDSLMFYNLFSILPGKKIRHFQNYFHTHQSQEFFINLLRFIHDNKIKDKDVYSFLVGFICHYALDSTLHPYIVYKTGMFIKGKPNTYKYNNVHTFMETFIDNDMVRRREKINPYRFNLSRYCFDIYPFSANLDKAINYTFYNTFQIKDLAKLYYKSLKQMRYSLRIFRKDVYGIKKNIYKLIDTFTTRGCFRFEAVSYHYPLEDRHNFLNSNHNMWRNPVQYDLTSTESFVDLYLKAIKFAKVLICASFDYLNDKDIDLEQIFTNLNYVTGLDCNIDKELKYFEF